MHRKSVKKQGGYNIYSDIFLREQKAGELSHYTPSDSESMQVELLVYIDSACTVYIHIHQCNC